MRYKEAMPILATEKDFINGERNWTVTTLHMF
jgi:hypothetical protein